jgi:hypothetical protein
MWIRKPPTLAQLAAMPDGHPQEAWPISNAMWLRCPSINLTAHRKPSSATAGRFLFGALDRANDLAADVS